jgi:hypothetical protein
MSEPVEPSPLASLGIKQIVDGWASGLCVDLNSNTRAAVADGFAETRWNEMTARRTTWLTDAGKAYAAARGWRTR